VPGLPNPLGLPAELVGALKLLPVIADRLGDVVTALGALSGLGEGVDAIGRDTAELRSVSEHTRHLPGMNDKLGVVANATDVLPTMDRRMATIEEAMPALLEVQQHLARLPESIEHLDAHIGRLAQIMDRLLESLGRLDDDVNVLSSSVEPLSRLADRMPGSRR
jgi:DNA repair ATPase RecN